MLIFGLFIYQNYLAGFFVVHLHGRVDQPRFDVFTLCNSEELSSGIVNHNVYVGSNLWVKLLNSTTEQCNRVVLSYRAVILRKL